MRPSPARIALVTGAAGFIGSHLCDRLIADGWTVRGMDIVMNRHTHANLAAVEDDPRFDFILADVREAGRWMPDILRDTTHVFHLAGIAGVRTCWGEDFDRYIGHNIEGTQRLLEACIGRPLRRFVYASSSSVYGHNAGVEPSHEWQPLEPVSPYGASKAAVEALCSAYALSRNVPTVGLRYFTVYGPRQRQDMAFAKFMQAALADQPITVFDDRHVRDFTFVADAVDATFKAGVQTPMVPAYNVGGGCRVRLMDAIQMIEEIAGRPLRLEPGQRSPGEAGATWADITLAQRDLGYRPRTTLRDGLARQWAALQAEVPA